MNNLFGAFGENIQGILSTDFWIGVFTPTPVLLRNTAGALYLYGLDRKTPAQLTVGSYLNINDNGVAGGIALANGAINRGYVGIAEAAGQFQANAAAGDITLRTAGGKLFLDTNNGSGTPSVTVLGSNGNVGIYQIAPAAPLHSKYAAANASVTAYNAIFDNPTGGTETAVGFAVNGTVGSSIRSDNTNLVLNTTSPGLIYLGHTDLGAATNLFIDGIVADYNSIATQGYGVPAIVSRVGLTAQGADIADTNLTNAGVVGEYAVDVYFVVTTADATAGSATVNIKWNDGTAARTLAATVEALTATNFGLNTLYMRLGSGNITYGVTHTGAYNAAKYALYISCHRVN